MTDTAVCGEVDLCEHKVMISQPPCWWRFRLIVELQIQEEPCRFHAAKHDEGITGGSVDLMRCTTQSCKVPWMKSCMLSRSYLKRVLRSARAELSQEPWTNMVVRKVFIMTGWSQLFGG